jgi:hypothetical protein
VKPAILFGTAVLAITAVTAFAPSAHAVGSWKRARIDACKAKSEGDACQYHKKGTLIQGTCQTSPHKKLICLTGDDSGSSGGTPPPSGGMAPSGEAPAPASP